MLDEVCLDWNHLNRDIGLLKEFIAKECTLLKRSVFRIGFILHKIEQFKLYKEFGFKNTSTLMEELFEMSPSIVSRFRTAYTYVVAISEALPHARVNESQIRALREVLNKDKTLKTGEEKTKEGVRLYELVYKNYGDKLTAKNIKAMISRSADAEVKDDKLLRGKIQIPDELRMRLSVALEPIYKYTIACEDEKEKLNIVLRELDVPLPCDLDTREDSNA